MGSGDIARGREVKKDFYGKNWKSYCQYKTHFSMAIKISIWGQFPSIAIIPLVNFETVNSCCNNGFKKRKESQRRDELQTGFPKDSPKTIGIKWNMLILIIPNEFLYHILPVCLTSDGHAYFFIMWQIMWEKKQKHAEDSHSCLRRLEFCPWPHLSCWEEKQF